MLSVSSHADSVHLFELQASLRVVSPPQEAAMALQPPMSPFYPPVLPKPLDFTEEGKGGCIRRQRLVLPNGLLQVGPQLPASTPQCCWTQARCIPLDHLSSVCLLQDLQHRGKYGTGRHPPSLAFSANAFPMTEMIFQQFQCVLSTENDLQQPSA